MLIRSLIVLVVIGAGYFAALGQNQEVHPGVKLYREGKYKDARDRLAAAVKDKANEQNAELWNVLGLAYVAENKFKDARKALEKAVSLDPGMASYHVNLAFVLLTLRQMGKARGEADKAIAVDPKIGLAYFIRGTAFYWDEKLDEADRDAKQAIALNEQGADGYILESRVMTARLSKTLLTSSLKKQLPLIEQAMGMLEAGIKKCKGNGCGDLKDEYDGLSVFVEYAKNRDADKPLTLADGTPPPPEPGVTPIKILSKPRPGYTDSARQSNTQGSIQLAVLFGANGRIQNILVLKRLGNGLDEQAVTAARKIQFEPMKRDGKAVPVIKVIEYTFSIY